MIKKLKAKQFSEEQLNALKTEATKQEERKGSPKSTDPVNYPVFEIPVNKRVLIYVPNHVVLDENGVERLRMDTPILHSVQDGSRFAYLRCVDGLSEEAGYGNGCPVCDGVSTCWDFANMEIENICERSGLSPDDASEQVKSIKSSSYSNRIIKDGMRYFTFPIVVFETEGDEGKKPIVEDGKLKYKIMWYHISENSYTEKWESCLEGMEDEPTHPGGHLFTLNYTYQSKTGNHNRRDSARNLKVIAKKLGSFEKIAKQLDAESEDWTPAKAMETVISNQYYDTEDLQNYVDQLLQPTRDMVDLYRSKASLGIADGKKGNEALPVGAKEEVFNLESLPTVEDD